MRYYTHIICLIFFTALFVTPHFAAAQVPQSLDEAVQNCARYLEGRFPRATRAAVIAIAAENPELGELIHAKLSMILVNSGWFTVVERDTAALESIAREMARHLNWEVSQETELSIGRQLGAEIIISGSITRLGQNWRLEVRALWVESAERAGQWSADVRSDPAWNSLSSPGTAGISFEGDSLSQRDRHTVVTGLRNAMQTFGTNLDLNENASPASGYGFTITVYLSRPPANPSLLTAEVTVTFSQAGRVLYQNNPYYITESTETLVARRIAERLRSDRAFFNRVNEQVSGTRYR